MADINPSLPAINELNATADPKILSALSSIVSTLNNVETANLADGAVTTVKLAEPSVTLAKLAAEITDLICPIGSILDYSGSGDPVAGKWVLADGRELLIASYAALYAAVGTSYGSLTNGSGGAGSTYFRVPDFGGRVAVAPDAARAAGQASRMSTSNTRGAATGVESLTLTEPHLPRITPAGTIGNTAHTHTGTTITQPDHAHFFSGLGGVLTSGNGAVYYAAASGSSGFGPVTPTSATAPGGAHGHTFTTDGATYPTAPTFAGTAFGSASPTAIDNRQPYLVVNKIIRVA